MFINLIIILIIWNTIIFCIRKKKYGKEFPQIIKILNLGSSHSFYAFNYRDKENCINLAEVSQTLYYDKMMFDYIFNRIDKNAVCFITLSYFSFAPKERWIKEDLLKYYKILPIKYFKGKEKMECVIFKYFPLIWSIRKKIIKKLKLTPKIVTDIQRIKGHVKKLTDERYKDYNIKIIEDILEKCKSKNITVIFVTTPFREYYNSFFSRDLLEEKFYKNIYELRQKYNLEYIDFSHNKIFDKEEYFDDYDHLNEKGSIVFMNELNKELWNKNIKLLK